MSAIIYVRLLGDILHMYKGWRLENLANAYLERRSIRPRSDAFRRRRESRAPEFPVRRYRATSSPISRRSSPVREIQWSTIATSVRWLIWPAILRVTVAQWGPTEPGLNSGPIAGQMFLCEFPLIFYCQCSAFISCQHAVFSVRFSGTSALKTLQNCKCQNSLISSINCALWTWSHKCPYNDNKKKEKSTNEVINMIW